MENTPLVQSLKQYEERFLGHRTSIKTFRESVVRKVANCENYAAEVENQVQSLETGIGNLSEQYKQILQAHTGFKTYFAKLNDYHQTLSQSFESDMEKLREIRLHPALTSSSLTTLLDCVPESKLRKWAADCEQEREQLASKVTELDREIASERENIGRETQTPVEIDMVSLRKDLQKARDIAAQVEEIDKLFEEDYLVVQGKVREALVSEPSASLWNYCGDFEDRGQNHEQLLASARRSEEPLGNIESRCRIANEQVSRSVESRLRSVTALEKTSREVAQRIILFNEALRHQKSAFQQLRYVQKIPAAYNASLDEVARRRRYNRKLEQHIGQVSGGITKMLQEEHSRRQSFLDSFGRYIPKELIPGLTENLPPFEVIAPAFDTNLPAIDKDGTDSDEDFTVLSSSTTERSGSRLQELEQENRRLSQELRTLKTDMGISRLNVSELGELLKVKDDLMQSKESASSYKKRIQLLESTLHSTYNKIESADSIVMEYQARFEEAEKELEQLRESQMELSHHNVQWEQNVQSLQKEKNHLQSKLGEVEEQLKQNEAKELRYKENLRKAAEEKMQENEQLAEAEKQVKLLTEQVEILTRDLEESKKKAESSHDELNQRIAELTRELQDTLEASTATQQTLEQKLLTANGGRETLEENLEEMNKRIEELTRELQDARDASRATQQTLEQELLTANGGRETLEENLEEKNKRIEELESTVRSLESDNAVKKEELIALQDEIDQKAKLADSQMEVSQKVNRDIETLRSEISAKTQTISELSKELRESKDKLAKAEKEKDDLKRSQGLLQQKEKETESRMKDVHSQAEELRKKICVLEEEKRRAQDVQQNLTESESEKSRVIQQLEKKLSQAEGDKKSLQKEIQGLEENVSQLKDSNADLNNRTGELMQIIEEIANAKKSDEQQTFAKTIAELESKLEEKEKSFKAYSQKYVKAVKLVEENTKKHFAVEQELKMYKEGLRGINKMLPGENLNASAEGFVQDVVKRVEETLTKWKDLDKRDKEESDRVKAMELALGNSQQESKKRIGDLESTITALELELTGKAQIALSNFRAGDFVLFAPNKNGHYEAVNRQCPNYFLLPSLAKDNFQTELKNKSLIFGQIVEIIESKSTLNGPFSLPRNTTFYEVLITKDEYHSVP